MYTPRPTPGRFRVIGGGWRGRVGIGTAWCAWPACSAKLVTRGLRETAVRGLEIAGVPGRGMVQVLASSMGVVVHPGLPLIKVVRCAESSGPGRHHGAICGKGVRARRRRVCTIEKGRARRVVIMV